MYKSNFDHPVNVCHLAFFRVNTNFVLLLGEGHTRRPEFVSVNDFLAAGLDTALLNTAVYCHEGGSTNKVNIFKKKLDAESRNIYNLTNEVNAQRKLHGKPEIVNVTAESFWENFPRLHKLLNKKSWLAEVDVPSDFTSDLIKDVEFDYFKLLELQRYFKNIKSPQTSPINELIFTYNLLHQFTNSIIIYHCGARHSLCIWDWVTDMAWDKYLNIHAGISASSSEPVLSGRIANQILAEFNAFVINRNDYYTQHQAQGLGFWKGARLNI